MHCIRFQLSLLFPTKTHSLHFLELELQLKHGTRDQVIPHFQILSMFFLLFLLRDLLYYLIVNFVAMLRVVRSHLDVLKLLLNFLLNLCIVMFGVLPLFYLFMILSSVLFSLMILPNIHGCSPYMLSQMFLKSFLLLNYKLKKLLSLKIKTFKSNGGSEFLSNNFQ